MNRRLIHALAFAGAVLGAGAAVGTVTSAPLMAVYNPSPSMPLGWYLRVPVDPAPGRIVVIDPPLGALFVGWPGHVRLIKPVAAAAGDRVCGDGKAIVINGKEAASGIIQVDGKRVQGWEGCRQLEPDELFLLAPMRADSVDSRVYGPVRKRDVLGVFTPIWTENPK